MEREGMFTVTVRPEGADAVSVVIPWHEALQLKADLDASIFEWQADYSSAPITQGISER